MSSMRQRREVGNAFGDVELIDMMFDFFEGESGGDIDTLVERDMGGIRRVRAARRWHGEFVYACRRGNWAAQYCIKKSP